MPERDGVRCSNPACGKRLGNEVLGFYRTVCPRCHQAVTVVVPGSRRLTVNGVTYEIDVRLAPLKE